MPNPMFNESTMRNASRNWAPPQSGTDYFPPVTDGPVTPWRTGVMTVGGTITAAAVLFGLLLVSASVGWIAATGPTSVEGEKDTFQFPALAMVGLLVGFACVIGLYFKPHLAKILGPIYALAQGFFLGAISKVYETFYDGIVVQAAGATIAVFGVMLVLYRTKIIKVTERFRRIVISATIGVMVFYGVCFVIRLFAGSESISFLSSPSLLSIAFSLFVAGLAAMNLALDFDFIERGSQQGLSKDFEWYAAFGLLVTVVWLYLEILRLLSKLRSR